ncbi:hypothetical protein CEXT_762081 [Caerostris extrusa]|uniref:Uncharacterized protein n=1 Tax=Caerostris extrusa TaxID=172846 RepID=A0AAV4SNR7_CAEEX|nr:hypothetical protein CEXT_762081 [Caerostris extrusa]
MSSCKLHFCKDVSVFHFLWNASVANPLNNKVRGWGGFRTLKVCATFAFYSWTGRAEDLFARLTHKLRGRCREGWSFYLMVADRIVKSFGILQEPDGFVAGGMENCAAFNRKFQQMRLDAFRACAKMVIRNRNVPLKIVFSLFVCLG